jgi:hypothetical protein
MATRQPTILREPNAGASPRLQFLPCAPAGCEAATRFAGSAGSKAGVISGRNAPNKPNLPLPEWRISLVRIMGYGESSGLRLRENKANFDRHMCPRLEIRDRRLGIRGRQIRETRLERMTNKPNLLRFWAENEGGVKNKANRRGRLGRRTDDRLRITDGLGLRLRGGQMRAALWDVAPNKANFAVPGPRMQGGVIKQSQLGRRPRALLVSSPARKNRAPGPVGTAAGRQTGCPRVVCEDTG